jgi:shikimate kinase
MKIILIGFMGSGKSEVGRELSKSLNLPFIEMDKLILQKSGRKNINEIFENCGELYFRKLEEEVAKQLATLEEAVISTGGGVVLDRMIIACLKNRPEDTVVWLATKFATICERLKNDKTRPLFADIKNAKKLYKARKTLYENYADMTIATNDKSIEDIAYEIAKGIGEL